MEVTATASSCTNMDNLRVTWPLEPVNCRRGYGWTGHRLGECAIGMLERAEGDLRLSSLLRRFRLRRSKVLARSSSCGLELPFRAPSMQRSDRGHSRSRY